MNIEYEYRKNNHKYLHKIIKTFQTEETIYRTFKELCTKYDSEIGYKLTELMIEFIKKNDKKGSKLNQWFVEPNAIALPGLFEDIKNWKQYLHLLDDNSLKMVDKKFFQLTNLITMQLRNMD